MHPVQPAAVSRASRAFSSLAVTVAMAALTILALAFGTVQDTKAEADSGVVLQEHGASGNREVNLNRP